MAAESGLARALRESPELEQALLGPPAEELGPADRMFRSFVLEERGDYEGAGAPAPSMSDLYTPEMNACREQAFGALLARLDGLELVFECRARALPTPVGEVLEAAIDRLPAAPPTEIDWVVVEAR